jgi:hypothetical protein
LKIKKHWIIGLCLLLTGIIFLALSVGENKQKTVKEGDLWLHQIGEWSCTYEIANIDENGVVTSYRSRDNPNNKAMKTTLEWWNRRINSASGKWSKLEFD